MTEQEFGEAVDEVTSEIAGLLKLKNRQYGNAALDPLRVFARDVPSSAGIKVRLDDKLSRLMRGADGLETEDVISDLMGYLVLLRIAEKHEGEAVPAGPLMGGDRC